MIAGEWTVAVDGGRRTELTLDVTGGGEWTDRSRPADRQTMGHNGTAGACSRVKACQISRIGDHGRPPTCG